MLDPSLCLGLGEDVGGLRLGEVGSDKKGRALNSGWITVLGCRGRFGAGLAPADVPEGRAHGGKGQSL